MMEGRPSLHVGAPVQRLTSPRLLGGSRRIVHTVGARVFVRSSPLLSSVPRTSPAGKSALLLQHCRRLWLVGRQWRGLLNLYWHLLEVEIGTLYKYRGTSPSSIFLKSLHIMGVHVSLNLPLNEKPSLHLYLAVYFSSSSMSLNVSSPQSQISFIKISTAKRQSCQKTA